MNNQSGPSSHSQSEIPRLNAGQWKSILAQSSLFFEVISNSMAPTFCAGDHVLVRPLKKNEPRPGQILAYFRGMLITHRYLGGGVCRGDNVFTKDLPVESADMVGIVTHKKLDGHLIPLNDGMPFNTRIHRLQTRIRHALHFVREAINGHLDS